MTPNDVGACPGRHPAVAGEAECASCERRALAEARAADPTPARTVWIAPPATSPCPLRVPHQGPRT